MTWPAPSSQSARTLAMTNTPEPTVQPVPVENVVGNQNFDYFSVKYNIQPSIKSVHVTCDNKFVVFGAMRKIFFKEIDTFQSRKMLHEEKLQYFGSKMNTLGTMKVQQIECHPRIPSVVASVSDNSLNLWSLQDHESIAQAYNCMN